MSTLPLCFCILLYIAESQKVSPSCSSKQFQCYDGTCISTKSQCDGCMDCPQGEDEILDPDSDPCQIHAYICHPDPDPKSLDQDSNTEDCLHRSSYCDGNSDCILSDDEVFCKPGNLTNLRCICHTFVFVNHMYRILSVVILNFNY